MKTSTLLPVVGILVLVISLLCVWFFPSVQDFMATNEMWNGISRFTQESRATSTDSLATAMPARGMLIAIAYLDYTEAELAHIERFVTGGGTLLLMDDFGYGNKVLAHLGIEARFLHDPLLDPLFCYKNPALPIITDFNPRIDGVEEVLMNHATTIAGAADAAVVARSSASSFMDANENSAYDEGEPKGPFVVAAVYKLGEGTAVLVSDPSILINSVPGRFDNFSFVAALSGGGTGQAVVIDRSHLAKAPLDVSKKRLTGIRESLASPYVVVILAAVVFVLSGTASRKGGILEQSGSR